MPQTIDALDQVALAADKTVTAVQDAQAALIDGDTHAAKDALLRADNQAQTAYLMLRDMGAHVPNAPVKAEVPLHLLSTPRSRDFLEALKAARTSAEAVDRERGWMANGEPCGWSDELDALIARLSLEVEGPKGRE